MAKNKKRKKFNSNNSHNKNKSFASGQRTSPITVKEKKKQLIRERIHSDPQKSRGMSALGIIAAAIIISRAALLIYEIAYFAYIGQKINVVSSLLFLPLLLILYVVHDGNRGLIGICAVSAVVRMIYLFVSVYPSLEGQGAYLVFVAVYAFIMAAQFIMSVTALSMPSTDIYSKEMQKINMELRAAIIGRR